MTSKQLGTKESVPQMLQFLNAKDCRHLFLALIVTDIKLRRHLDIGQLAVASLLLELKTELQGIKEVNAREKKRESNSGDSWWKQIVNSLCIMDII